MTEASTREIVEIRPNSRPQTIFLSTPADIAIYGGAAGGGKTWALLLDPLRHINNSDFGATVFRRTYRQVMHKGGMWEESRKLYPHLGARPAWMKWTFPSGAIINFAYMKTENDKFQYDGAQIPQISFDQLEHFTELQFFYMLSRNRSMCGVRPYIRATCNPDADSWLSKFLEWWINPDTGYAIEERSGVLRWMVRSGDDLHWGDSREEMLERFPEIIPLTVTFIPAKVHDNIDLLENDPAYISRLMGLPKIERERLLKGNWKIRAGAGLLFNRAWFSILPACPSGGIAIRFWDFAATEKKLDKQDPDYTASVLIRFVDGTYYIEDCTDGQLAPLEAEKQFYNLSVQDYHRFRRIGVQYKVRWEVEPGSAAVREAVRFTRQLAKMIPSVDAKGVPSTGDKIQRAQAFSAQSEVGNVMLVNGPWNERWLNHMHNQPTDHDDIMDASSGAFNSFETLGWARGAG